MKLINDQDEAAISAALSKEIQAEYTFMRVIPDGRICGVHRLMFHWTLHIDIDEWGHADRYCYGTELDALIAMVAWSGIGDPIGWHRHPYSGRRRDAETGEIHIAW